MFAKKLAREVFEAEKRRAERVAVFFRSRWYAPGQAPVAVQVVDVSRYGFMARTDAPFVPEMRGELDLPVLGRIDSRIVWVLGGRVGAEFPNGLDPDDHERLLAAVPRGQ